MFGVLAASTVLVSGVAAADLGPAPEQAPATLASEVLLSKGRVKVGVTWKNPYTGQTGTAKVLPQGDEFAYFTFSSEANPEVFVKVLGGNDPNYIQLFAAGLTTFEYTATFTGCNTKKTFTKPAYARITYEDAAAFPSTACQPADPLDDSHYVLLKKDQTSGRIAYVHVHRIRDGRRVFIGYPYGRGLAAVASGTEVRMTMSGLKDFVRSQPPPPPPNTPYSIAPLLGYNPSTGQAPGQCYNINILPPQNPSLATSFSSANTSSSFSGQTNISASVGASFGAFKASDTFSHGDSYNSSANSGAVFFNASAIYTINSSIDPANPLTVQGQAAKTNNQLSQLCGIETMASVPAGMLVSGQFSWSSDSSATSTTISNTMKTSYGLAKVSNAISNAKAQGSSNITLNFVTQMEGGGSAAVTQMASDIAALDPAIASCGNGTASACTAFASGADAAALKAVSTFTNSVTSTMTDFSSFVPFPQGVAGVSTTPLSTLPAVPASDALAPYQAQLRTYLTLLNQIATLDNRVNLYISPFKVRNFQILSPLSAGQDSSG